MTTKMAINAKVSIGKKEYILILNKLWCELSFLKKFFVRKLHFKKSAKL